MEPAKLQNPWETSQQCLLGVLGPEGYLVLWVANIEVLVNSKFRIHRENDEVTIMWDCPHKQEHTRPVRRQDWRTVDVTRAQRALDDVVVRDLAVGLEVGDHAAHVVREDAVAAQDRHLRLLH